MQWCTIHPNWTQQLYPTTYGSFIHSFIHSFCGGLYPRLGKSACVRVQQKIVTSGVGSQYKGIVWDNCSLQV